MTEPLQIHLEPHSDYIPQMERFAAIYDLVDAKFPIESNKKNLKHKSKRVCRFCGRSNGSTNFKKDAHFLPELIGNKTWYSDFECDFCNQHFGTYEDDFAKFLGVFQTLNGVRGKEKIPKFKSPDKLISAQAESFFRNNVIKILREDTANNVITTSVKDGVIKIKFQKQPYSPVKVYKTLLKIAISLLEETEVMENYKHAIDFLLERKNVKLTGCLLGGYQLPLNINFSPHVYLFRKKSQETRMHTHIMALYFQNFIFSLPIPLNEKDYFFYGTSTEIINYPPLFTQFTNANGFKMVPFLEDFSESEKAQGQEDELIIELQREDMEKAAGFNMHTQDVSGTGFNPSELVQIMIGEETLLIPLNDFRKGHPDL